MADISKEKVRELIDEIRGSTAIDSVKEQVKKVIEADKLKAEEVKKAGLEVKKDITDKLKKIKDDLKAEEKLKAEIEKKKGDKKSGKKKGNEEDDEEDEEFQEGEEDTGSDEEGTAESKIKALTKTLEKMNKEIKALKKRKNYRTKPPKSKKVDELSDFIKQNTQLMDSDIFV
ncbi:hypothetical protein LCGC14_0910920 [marine sediment metagenome]|uniref:Uncharacterized protein n=1 Tax=marine sediment metagenome TaxID=412755 RepID=A0A0F9PEH7_9ZZZZ